MLVCKEGQSSLPACRRGWSSLPVCRDLSISSDLIPSCAGDLLRHSVFTTNSGAVLRKFWRLSILTVKISLISFVDYKPFKMNYWSLVSVLLKRVNQKVPGNNAASYLQAQALLIRSLSVTCTPGLLGTFKYAVMHPVLGQKVGRKVWSYLVYCGCRESLIVSHIILLSVTQTRLPESMYI